MKKLFIKLTFIKECVIPLLFVTSKNLHNRLLLWQTKRAIDQQQKIVDRLFDRSHFANPLNRKEMVRELIEVDRRLSAMKARTRLLDKQMKRLTAIERLMFRQAFIIIFKR